MADPLSELLSWGYAQEEITAFIAKYPKLPSNLVQSINTHDTKASIITESIAAEFEVISKKILECVKEEMKGSPEDNQARDHLGNTYASGIERDYYNGIRPESHYGYPGAQWIWDTSIPGTVFRRISVLNGLCRRGKSYRLQKQKRKDVEEIFNEYVPILQKSLVITRLTKEMESDKKISDRYSLGDLLRLHVTSLRELTKHTMKVPEPLVIVEENIESRIICCTAGYPKFFILCQFERDIIKEIEERIGLHNGKSLTDRVMELSVGIILKFCENELHRQKVDYEVDYEVERRLAKDKFDEGVKAELKRRADKQYFDK